MAEAATAPGAAAEAEVDLAALFTWLRSVDIESLDAATLGQAMCATRPLRGWLDVVDARIRGRHRVLMGVGGGAGAGGSGAGSGAGASGSGGAGSGAGSGGPVPGQGGPVPPAPSGLFPLPTSGASGHSMNTSAGVGSAEGRRRDACSHIIERFPELEALLSAGRITIEHVEVLARALRGLDPKVDRAVSAEQAKIIGAVQRLDPARLRRFLTQLITRLTDRVGLEKSRTSKPVSTLSHWICRQTGMGKLSAQLNPDDYQRVAAIIEAGTRAAARAAGTDIRDHDRGQLAAQALLDLLGANDHDGCGGSGRGGSDTGCSACGGDGGRRGPGAQLRAHISVIVDERTLFEGPHAHSISEYADGTPLDWPTLQRMACGASISPIITASGGKVPFAMGREVRHATIHQRRALEAVYATCAMPGCDTAVTRCHIHHIIYWFALGRTDLENLLPVCSYHHHRVHEEEWKLTLADDRTLTVTYPDGSVQTAVPDRLTRVAS